MGPAFETLAKLQEARHRQISSIQLVEIDVAKQSAGRVPTFAVVAGRKLLRLVVVDALKDGDGGLFLATPQPRAGLEDAGGDAVRLNHSGQVGEMLSPFEQIKLGVANVEQRA